jgi:hypothetical protein
MTAYRYVAFGLTIESDTAITSLMPSELPFAGEPDVQIVAGEVKVPADADHVDGIQVKFEGDDCFMHIDECGSFQVVGGCRVVVQPDAGATAEQVNLYLLGSVFGVLLHQRGMLPFHCNAVEFERSAFLFCGDSGSVKSTLAAHFLERGFRLLSDDVCALYFGADGQLLAAPGIARLKLWQDTLEAFGRSSEGLRLVPWYDSKFELPLIGAMPREPLPIAAVYHLRVVDEVRNAGIHRLKGLEAANSVTANIYRRRLADLAGAAPFYVSATARIVEQIPIFTMNRTWGFDCFRDEVAAVERHMRQLLADTDGVIRDGVRSPDSRSAQA